MEEYNKWSISIIGSGNIGKRIGLHFSNFNNVIFYDINRNVIKDLNKSGHKTTLDINFAINYSDISFITVPTPLDNNNLYDTSFLEEVSESIGNVLKNKNKCHTIVIKSTVIPGTTEELIPIIEKYSGKVEGKDFYVLYNPEFLTVISNTWNDDKRFCISADNESRIILGESDSNKKAGDIIERLYQHMNPHIPVLRTDYKTAEMTKLVANNRLALTISFSNEIFLVCEEMRNQGIDMDVDFVIKSMSIDPRIGKYGSVFKMAFGGPCFLKDTVALETFIKNKTGKCPGLISKSIEINNEMKEKYGIRESTTPACDQP